MADDMNRRVNEINAQLFELAKQKMAPGADVAAIEEEMTALRRELAAIKAGGGQLFGYRVSTKK